MRRCVRIRLKHIAWRAARWAIAPIALLGLRLAWGIEASHRLAAEQAMFRMQGIAITSDEFPDTSRIPPAEDAVVPFLRAELHFKLNSDDDNLVTLSDKSAALDRVQFTPREIESLRRIWNQHQDVIADLDLSQSRPRGAWPTDLDNYFGMDSKYSLGGSRTLALWFGGQAIIDASLHHDADALRNLRRIMNLARIQGAQPLFIAYLITGAMRFEAVSTFERLEPSLDWNNPEVITEARALLQDFQAVKFQDALGVWSSEIAFLHYDVDRQRQLPAWWLAPLYDDDEARALGRYAANLPALRATSEVEFKSHLVTFPTTPDQEYPQLLSIYSKDTDISSHYGLLIYIRVVDTHACEWLLAARLSNHDHGHFPAFAAEMVPQYLPGLATDPFDPAAKPLRYRLDPAGPTVWSVGENGSDENALLIAAPSNVFRSRGNPDIVYGAAWRAFLAAHPGP